MGMDPNSQNLSQDPHHAQNNVSTYLSSKNTDEVALLFSGTTRIWRAHGPWWLGALWWGGHVPAWTRSSLPKSVSTQRAKCHLRHQSIRIPSAMNCSIVFSLLMFYKFSELSRIHRLYFPLPWCKSCSSAFLQLPLKHFCYPGLDQVQTKWIWWVVCINSMTQWFFRRKRRCIEKGKVKWGEKF